nr:hypothetical protein Iba_chr14aCG5460 [Ipomoea batatas]
MSPEEQGKSTDHDSAAAAVARSLLEGRGRKSDLAAAMPVGEQGEVPVGVLRWLLLRRWPNGEGRTAESLCHLAPPRYRPCWKKVATLRNVSTADLPLLFTEMRGRRYPIDAADRHCLEAPPTIAHARYPRHCCSVLDGRKNRGGCRSCLPNGEEKRGADSLLKEESDAGVPLPPVAFVGAGCCRDDGAERTTGVVHGCYRLELPYRQKLGQF